MNNAKRGVIPPYSVFFLFYISRVVVSLTYIQSICVGYICTDLLVSIGLSFLITLVFSLPAYLCSKYSISPLDNNFVGLIYLAFFVIKASVNISRFTGFATSRLNPDSTNLFFAILICIGVCYCACLGIEGLSRFSIYAASSIMIVALTIIILNFDNTKSVNLYPIIQNTNTDILKNAIFISANSIEPALLFALSKRINGDTKKPFFLSIIAQYLTIFLLVLMMVLVLGSNSILQPYPIFTLFQMATGKTLARLDIMHTAFWVLAAFVKCTALIYCGSICIKKYRHSSKCVALTVAALTISVLMTEVFTSQLVDLSKILSVIIYIIFCALIPVICLVIKKKEGVK